MIVLVSCAEPSRAGRRGRASCKSPPAGLPQSTALAFTMKHSKNTITTVVYAGSEANARSLLPACPAGWKRDVNGPEEFHPGPCHCEDCRGKLPPLPPVWRIQAIDTEP